MRKKAITILTIIMAFCCITAKAQTNTTIKATLPGIPNGTVVYISHSGSKVPIDSVFADQGKFQFKLKLTEGDLFVLEIGKSKPMDPWNNALLYLEPGELIIQGKSELLSDATTSGSQFGKDMDDVEQTIKQAPSQANWDKLLNLYIKAYKENDTLAIAKLQPQLMELDSIKSIIYKQWVSKHLDSPIAVFVLYVYLGQKLTPEETEKYYYQLKPSALNNALAKKIEKSIQSAKITAIGKIAPDFTQNDTSNIPVALHDFRGKYVLIDFWASWCGPCRKENPNLVKTYAHFKDKNFAIIGVSLDQPDGKGKWLKAIHDDGLTWTHVSDLKFWKNAVAVQYGIQGVPSNLLLDTEGRIIAKDLRGEDLENKLKEVLK